MARVAPILITSAFLPGDLYFLIIVVLTSPLASPGPPPPSILRLRPPVAGAEDVLAAVDDDDVLAEEEEEEDDVLAVVAEVVLAAVEVPASGRSADSEDLEDLEDFDCLEDLEDLEDFFFFGLPLFSASASLAALAAARALAFSFLLIWSSQTLTASVASSTVLPPRRADSIRASLLIAANLFFIFPIFIPGFALAADISLCRRGGVGVAFGVGVVRDYRGGNTGK